MPLTYLRCVQTIARVAVAGAKAPPVRPASPSESGRASLPEKAPEGIPPLARSLRPPTPAPGTMALVMPTTAETVQELKRRLGKELYRIEMDLQGGARIAGKPCDCLSRSKHLGGVEATAEELMSYERNPTYSKVVDWLNLHAAEFEPAEIAKRPPEYYRGLAPEVRAFRKEVMGTERLGPLPSTVPEAEEGGNPGNPSPAVRFVGVGPPPPPPWVKPVEERRPERRPRLPPRPLFALVTPEERQKMRQLKEEGLKFYEIAERMGRSLSVVWRNITRVDEPRRRAITPQRQQDAILLRRMGLSLEEIGRRMGVTGAMVHYILHRAGERVDLIEAAQRLNRRLMAVSAGLVPPATYDLLARATEQMRRIAEDAALINEITPEEVLRPLQDYPYEIGWTHSRALLAELVLSNGVWCLLRMRLEDLPAVREQMGNCAEATRDIARGVIEGWEGYEVKAEQTVRQIEEIMALSDAEVPEPTEVAA